MKLKVGFSTLNSLISIYLAMVARVFDIVPWNSIDFLVAFLHLFFLLV
jgi:hypothetical protein